MFGVSPLTPAYGRDYHSKKAVLEDFNADLDFETPSGQYTNRADLIAMNVSEINIRYGKLRKVMVAKVA